MGEDIADGHVLLGEVGEGDELGLGAEQSFSILNLAEMFGAEVEMRPETKGNRMGAKLGFTKAHALGWYAQRRVVEYIQGVTEQ